MDYTAEINRLKGILSSPDVDDARREKVLDTLTYYLEKQKVVEEDRVAIASDYLKQKLLDKGGTYVVHFKATGKNVVVLFKHGQYYLVSNIENGRALCSPISTIYGVVRILLTLEEYL